MAHHIQVAGQAKGQEMFYYLRQNFCRPSMSVDTYNVVENCASCACERIKTRKHATELKLLPATEPLMYVSINILGPLMESNSGSTALLVKTDHFSKLIKTVPLSTKIAQDIATVFSTNWNFFVRPTEQAFCRQREADFFTFLYRRMSHT